MGNFYMRFPGGLGKCLTLSYDDAVIQDERLMGIMRAHGLKGTFNINTGLYADKDYDDSRTTHRRMTKERCLKLYKNSGFEVACHGYTHPWLEQLPLSVATREVLKDRISIEADYDVIARGMAYPYGTYSEDVKAALRSCGIVYSRTVWSSHSFDIPKDWLELRPTCHHADPELNSLTERFLNGKPYAAPWLFYVWGHSYEFDFNDNWNIIEDFASGMDGRSDVWFANNIEVYDYVQAYKQLVFNADMSVIYNPTVTEIFFSRNDIDFSIKPGETLRF